VGGVCRGRAAAVPGRAVAVPPVLCDIRVYALRRTASGVTRTRIETHDNALH